MVILGFVAGILGIFVAANSDREGAQVFFVGLSVGCSVAFAVFLWWKLKRTEPGYANLALYHVVDVLVIQSLVMIVAAIFGSFTPLAAAAVSALLLVSHIIIGIIELCGYKRHYVIDWAVMSLYPLISGAIGLIASLLMYFNGGGVF